jgi:hypothetical protein
MSEHNIIVWFSGNPENPRTIVNKIIVESSRRKIPPREFIMEVVECWFAERNNIKRGKT